MLQLLQFGIVSKTIGGGGGVRARGGDLDTDKARERWGTLSLFIEISTPSLNKSLLDLTYCVALRQQQNPILCRVLGLFPKAAGTMAREGSVGSERAFVWLLCCPDIAHK